MTAAIVVTIPVRQAFEDYLALPVMSAALSKLEVDRLLARYTDNAASSGYQLKYIGSGQWTLTSSLRSGEYVTDWSLPTLAVDHLYLISPEGVMQGFAVQKTASTTTAPGVTDNNATTLIDSAADFSTGVAIGDFVILANGSVAMILAIDSANDTLTTEALSDGGTYAAGQTYYIVRAPGSDVTDFYTATGRRVYMRDASLWQLNRWLTSKSFDPQISIGSGSLTPNTDPIRQRIDDLMGVRYGG